jgi:hypothetical protein
MLVAKWMYLTWCEIARDGQMTGQAKQWVELHLTTDFRKQEAGCKVVQLSWEQKLLQISIGCVRDTSKTSWIGRLLFIIFHMRNSIYFRFFIRMVKL